ncbi:MAG: nucleoside triphosphate pyrophosphohydrolase [Oscillospiraceae bacterium]|nr:nucleoside triphosphate pyrophosphohydrolase [Oscillospiraceae bacterium]
MDFEFKQSYSVEDLIRIVAMLRAPGGCPWDIEQTHESIRSNFIEEAYEAAEAIDTGDKALLCEELGDVLLQVVFHCQMEREIGSFDLDQVADGICKKLILRHPHVFGEVIAETSAEVLRNWDSIKQKSKGQKSQTQAMEGISSALPALMRSQKIQQKAAKVGFDWTDISGAVEKLDEEVLELKQAISSGDTAHAQEELGDVLFSAVNAARFLGCDAEGTLEAANKKFIRRFALVEQAAKEAGLDMSSASLKELDALWEKAKEV